MSTPSDPPVVSVRDLRVKFVSRDRVVHAVNGLDFTLNRGEVLSIIGESGSGKSVTLRALMRLLPSKAEVSGQVSIDGHDIVRASTRQLEDIRGPVVSMIFQEPALAFDPVYTIGEQIIEMITRHERCGRRAARGRALELLELVQIPSAARRLDAYAHELSGGMRQRAMIALALSCRPSVLLADEPTTALDATVQIQILLLLRSLQRQLGMAVIFVTHDMGVAIEIADELAVMYAGQFVERGPTRQMIAEPAHPYTQGLLSSTVRAGMRGQRLQAIPGAPPDLSLAPAGCGFAPRCSFAQSRCFQSPPMPIVTAPRRMVRCVLAESPENVGSGSPTPAPEKRLFTERGQH
jgi:peptide/nickel transport system ATP-binding protein